MAHAGSRTHGARPEVLERRHDVEGDPELQDEFLERYAAWIESGMNPANFPADLALPTGAGGPEGLFTPRGMSAAEARAHSARNLRALAGGRVPDDVELPADGEWANSFASGAKTYPGWGELQGPRGRDRQVRVC